ncbi:MAG TPA: NUDIX domain-containing protein [Symbiobacteriaceae bacterium]|nr:NUDIX domain-containing protein [Symbiobacteriaceae bacterium]
MVELWDILDKNGNVTGRVHERGKPMNKGEYHLEVNVWIENDNGEYLISQRSPNKTFPNMWECTGGNAVAGDDSLATALKEAKEELGIILEPQNGRMIQHHLRCGNVECHGLVDVWLFRQNVDISTVILAPDETCNAMWASRDEINRMIDEGTFTTWEQYTYIDELFEEIKMD